MHNVLFNLFKQASLAAHSNVLVITSRCNYKIHSNCKTLHMDNNTLFYSVCNINASALNYAHVELQLLDCSPSLKRSKNLNSFLKVLHILAAPIHFVTHKTLTEHTSEGL